MRSCKYLKVKTAKQRRNKIVHICNISFITGTKQLSHDHPQLKYANSIAITFKHQKKDEKTDTITLMASEDAILCPVRAEAAIVKRIKKYPGTTSNSPISMYSNNGIIDQVTSDHMINALRDAVGGIEETCLGIKKEDVGTHLIRSDAAMTMYLGECPVFMIMLIGRWSSNAFLRYIIKEVMEFSQNVAKRMLACQNFRHIPDIHTQVAPDDPIIRNYPENAETRGNVGDDTNCRVRLPPFSWFN
jgi:hypothetical protein